MHPFAIVSLLTRDAIETIKSAVASMPEAILEGHTVINQFPS